MSDPASLGPAEGFTAAEVEEEFPGLRLHWMTIEGRLRGSPRSLQRRLRDLAGRYRGQSVVALRTKPIPQAYRAFFRQIGLDPDVRRIPSEGAAVARLLQGGFRSVDLVHDACLVALIETGIPVWPMDADALDVSGLGIRTASPEDRAALAGEGGYLEEGTLVIADHQRPHAVLFEEPLAGRRVSRRTRRIAIFSVAVNGVPPIHVEEALWMCSELLH
jgi:DNA/RNA-binding domain of Phe-tRNA-synthetase-like protein